MTQFFNIGKSGQVAADEIIRIINEKAPTK